MTPSPWNAQTAGPQRQEAEQWTHTEEPGAVLLIGAAGCLLSSPTSPASLPSKRARPCAPLLDLCPSFRWFPPLSSLFISLLLLLPSATAPPSTTNPGLQYGPFSSAHPYSRDSHSAHHLMGVSELRTSEACSPRRPPSPETPASVSSSYWPSPWNSRLGPHTPARQVPGPDGALSAMSSVKLATPSDSLSPSIGLPFVQGADTGFSWE